MVEGLKTMCTCGHSVEDHSRLAEEGSSKIIYQCQQCVKNCFHIVGAEYVK